MYAGRPIIGILGGIGSGKSFVAGLFGEMGCRVIDSDRQVAQAYEREDVKKVLRQWWGREVFDRDGRVDRGAIARRVFSDERELRRLEGLVHPVVSELRDRQMREAAADPSVVAYVWDTPLLLEAGLAEDCDALVFVECPARERQRRVMRSRGWTAAEWARREKKQLPLDKKRKAANYIVRNTAGADQVRSQVREVLSRILAASSDGQA